MGEYHRHLYPAHACELATAVQRLCRLLYRNARSTLPSAGRALRMCLHYWKTVGKSKCKAARAKGLAQEGLRASENCTSYVVSNVAAREYQGSQPTSGQQRSWKEWKEEFLQNAVLCHLDADKYYQEAASMLSPQMVICG